MEPLSSLLTLMALTGSIFLFTPDTVNRVSFAQGELFLPPLASRYERGFTAGYYVAEANVSANKDMVVMNIAKGFSIQRFYLPGTRIIELGGHAGAHNQFEKRGEELLLLNTDAVVGMNVGYLVGSLVTKLIWEYEHHQMHNGNGEDAMPAGDSLHIFFGDLRKSFRYYLAYGGFQRTNLAKKSFVRYGFDYRTPPTDISIRIILGAEQRSYAINNGAVTNILRLGVEKSQNLLEAWQIVGEWRSRQRDYGPYPDADMPVAGIRFQRVF